MVSRYYQKQQLEDQLRRRRERLRESRAAEEVVRAQQEFYERVSVHLGWRDGWMD